MSRFHSKATRFHFFISYQEDVLTFFYFLRLSKKEFLIRRESNEQNNHVDLKGWKETLFSHAEALQAKI